MKIAVVTGANGFVGSHLCRELLANGYRVRALHRESSNLSLLKGLAVEHTIGDVRDKQSLNLAFAGADYVFHIAALYREAKFPDQVYFDVNLGGTQNVLDAAIEQGVAKVINTSTIGVHSHIANPPANESEPYAPTDVYQESKVAAEKLSLEYFRSGKIAGHVIRPAMIWGPGDTRFLKMFRGIARRRFPIIGSGKILTHWIWVEDLARAYRLAAERDLPSGQVFIIAGERPVPLEYVIHTVARELGVRPLPFKVPAWPVQLVGTLVEALCKPFGIEPPLHRRRADFFIKNRAFDCAKAQGMLGFKPKQSFEGEAHELAGWYRANNLL